jgi:hypothetical protein
MSDPKMLAIAKNFLDHGIKNMFDTALKAMEVDIKKNPKAYYKASRMIFKALVAASAQRLLEDGANTKLLSDTYYPRDAWELYLQLHPDIAAKLEPKPPPKPKAKLQVIEGGKPPDAPFALECASGCHGVFTSVEAWQNHTCETPEQAEAALAEDEEALLKDDDSCGCACHFEHDEWVATGHDCCINETKGDEVP